jgi:hypothetical protein
VGVTTGVATGSKNGVALDSAQDDLSKCCEAEATTESVFEFVGPVPVPSQDVGKSRKRSNNPPPVSNEDGRSYVSGPWSVDWLQNVQQGDIGLISSKNKRLKKVVKKKRGNGEGKKQEVCKKKVGGVLRHPVLTLKKVARLPSKDREEVMKVLRDSKIMKALKQKIRNRRRQRERVSRSLEMANSNNQSSSTASVNDWTNWVVLNGSEETRAADIQFIGKALGVSTIANSYNKFSALSRPRKIAAGPILELVNDEGRTEEETV